MKIALNENISLDRPTLEQLITSTQSDIRQVINQLSLWKRTRTDFSYDGVKKVGFDFI